MFENVFVTSFLRSFLFVLTERSVLSLNFFLLHFGPVICKIPEEINTAIQDHSQLSLYMTILFIKHCKTYNNITNRISGAAIIKIMYQIGIQITQDLQSSARVCS